MMSSFWGYRRPRGGRMAILRAAERSAHLHRRQLARTQVHQPHRAGRRLADGFDQPSPLSSTCAQGHDLFRMPLVIGPCLIKDSNALRFRF